jgi:hypothetical protein
MPSDPFYKRAPKIVLALLRSIPAFSFNPDGSR